LRSAAGSRIRIGSEYRAMCFLPVKFWDSNKAIAAERQTAAIVSLSATTRKQGKPLEKHGFDFDLGHLKFEKKEYRGTVKYLEYTSQHCGKL